MGVAKADRRPRNFLTGDSLLTESDFCSDGPRRVRAPQPDGRVRENGSHHFSVRPTPTPTPTQPRVAVAAGSATAGVAGGSIGFSSYPNSFARRRNCFSVRSRTCSA